MFIDSTRSSWFAPVLAIVLLVLPTPVRAGQQTLLRLIEVLRDNGTIEEDVYTALRDEVLAEEQAPPVSAAAPEAGPSVSFGEKGLEVESADGDFSFELGGRLHVDSAWYDDDAVPMGNGTRLRRVRLSWGATFWRDWFLRTAVDFAGNRVALRGATLGWQGSEYARVTIGSFKEPFSLERLTSSNNTLFMERASPVVLLSPDRHVGVAVSAQRAGATGSVGFFGGDEADDEEFDESWGTAGRVTYAPFRNEGRVLHFGAATTYREYDSRAEIDFSDGPESSITDVEFTDTGDLVAVDDVLRAGAELAGVFGPLFFQSEYLFMRVERSAGLPDLDFHGWYAQLGWVLTGESHRYSTSRAIFSSPKPAHRLGKGGFGAWELALRVSGVDLNDEDIVGGRQTILGVGLNWYPNANLRFMANYMNVLDVDRPGTIYDGASPQVFQLRGQLAF